MKVLLELMLEGCRHAREKEKKPVLISIALDPYLEDEEDRNTNLMIKKAFVAKGFPVYANLDAAIRTLAHLYKFGRSRRLGFPHPDPYTSSGP